MPSTTPKQRKVMSAISHGWHPSHGSVAKIPLKVAKEFHAADKGHKYGKGMHSKKKADGGKIEAAMSTVRKYTAKKAEGGHVKKNPSIHSTQGFTVSPNVEDRRGEWQDRFHDSLYFPEGPQRTTGQGGTPGYVQQPYSATITPMAADLGEQNLVIGPQPPSFADGGDVDEDNTPDPFASEKFVPPPIANAIPQVASNDVAALKNFAAAGFQRPDTSQEHVRFKTANPMTDITDEDMQRGTNVALAAGTGMEGWTKGFTKKAIDSGIIPQIHDMVLGASAIPAEMHPAAGALAKQLKANTGKDLATSAYYLGVSPGDIENNLKSYMSKGAQQNFDDHYNKLVPPKTKPAFDYNSLTPEEYSKAQNIPITETPNAQSWQPTKATEVPDVPSFKEHFINSFGKDQYEAWRNKNAEPAPDDWWVREIEAGPGGETRTADQLIKQYQTHYKGNDKAAWAGFHEDYDSGEIADSPTLQKVQQALTDKWNPGDEVSSEPYDAQQEYEAAQAKHESQDFTLDPASPKPREPENVLHQSFSPADLEKKSSWLGLNTTVFHGTRKNFSEFKLPEELGGFPELGVHFGTLRAAIDRAGRGLGKDVRSEIENQLRAGGANVAQSNLSLRPEVATKGFQFNVMPLRIGANNPLYLNKDMGNWNPTRIRDALNSLPEFSPDEVTRAMTTGKKDIELNSFQEVQDNVTKQIQQLRKLIESHGYDSMSYRNNVEDEGSLSYIIWNLNRARSFYAKFDPAKAGSRDLGAAIGGLSLVPLGLYADRQSQGNGMAEGGAVGDDYNTVLSPEDEANFQVWKQQNMPNDSGVDYDQRGAYMAQFQQQANGHWQDQFKKPNHPTFSDQSQYAVGDQRNRAGYWNDDQFIPPAPLKKGGKVKHKQIDEDPQDHEFIDFSKGGLIDSDIPGRTDKIPMKVPPGSFVLPADIPSALGQGNTKAGSEVLKKMFTSGPYGLPPPKGVGHAFSFPHHFSMSQPHQPPTPKQAQGGKVKATKTKVDYREADTAHRCGTCKYAYGPTGQRHCQLVEGMIKPDDVCNLWEGKIAKKAEGGPTEHVPIITAGGEFIIHPDVVKDLGEGDMKQGHKLLNKFVVHTRKQHIKTLKGLKPPK